MTLTASQAAAAGSAAILLRASSSTASETVQVNVAVTPSTLGTFTLSAISPGLTLAQGGSASTTVHIARQGGFAAPVVFTALEPPTGLSAVFTPASATGTSTTVTVAASGSAPAGAATILVSATGAGITRTVVLPVTIAAGGSSGTVTVLSKVNVSQPWYNEVAVQVNNTAPITALSVTIHVRKTPGINYAGQYNTVGGQIGQSNRATTTTIVYEYVLTPGQVLTPRTHAIFAAQASGSGVAHPASGDTYEVRYTTGGSQFVETGHF